MRGEWGGLSIPEHQSKVCVGGSGHSRGQHSPAAAPGAGETPGASPGEAQCSATAPVHHSFAPCLQEGGNAGSSVVENGGSRCQERGCHGTATAWLRRRGADSSVGGEDRAEPRAGTLQGPHWHGGGFCTSPHRRAPGSDAGSIEGVHPLIPPPRPIPVQSAVLPAHCCLQVESLRILLLAEQALREGLEEALARRSALDLVLSCPGSVPFMQMALGSPRPRLCPFCPASSSGTCPAREGSVRLWQHGAPWPPCALHRSEQRRRKPKAKGEQVSHCSTCGRGLSCCRDQAQPCALQGTPKWGRFASPAPELPSPSAQLSDSAPGAQSPQERCPCAVAAGAGSSHVPTPGE